MGNVIQDRASSAERDARFRALIEAEGQQATDAQLRIEIPEPVENGLIVPINIVCTVPGTEAIALFVEDGGPFFVGSYTFTQGTDAHIGTRIRISRSAKVKAIALTPGGLLVAERMAKVESGYGANFVEPPEGGLVLH